jgi:hypothetical protein
MSARQLDCGLLIIIGVAFCLSGHWIIGTILILMGIFG